MQQKEVTKYIQDKEKLIKLLKANCEFFQISDDGETIQYNLPEGMTSFAILNIPPKTTKEEVKKNIELINLQYNRLYKRGFYWVLTTVDRETVICIQNSLRELHFDEIKVRYDLSNKNQILRAMKEQIEKASYQKESKNLGVPSNNNHKNKNNYYKQKGSDTDSDAFSWRKGSGDGKSSFDYNEKSYNKKGGYKNYKRTRFNSDGGQKYNKEYAPQNSSFNQDIEIDISKINYSLNIKYKYSFFDIKKAYQKLKESKAFEEKPKPIDEEISQIFCEKPKEIFVLDELIESSSQAKKTQPGPSKPTEEKESEKINPNIKIPKMNPLSGMGKSFNKFDIIPGNLSTLGSYQGMMAKFQPSTIEESNKEEEK